MARGYRVTLPLTLLLGLSDTLALMNEMLFLLVWFQRSNAEQGHRLFELSVIFLCRPSAKSVCGKTKQDQSEFISPIGALAGAAELCALPQANLDTLRKEVKRLYDENTSSKNNINSIVYKCAMHVSTLHICYSRIDFLDCPPSTLATCNHTSIISQHTSSPQSSWAKQFPPSIHHPSVCCVKVFSFNL